MTDLKPEDLGEASALLMDLARRFMLGEIIGQTPYAAKCAVAMEMVTTDLADRARMEKAIELLCEVYEAARDVSMAAVQDDDGEWSIKGDPEAMLGRLYLATEEVRKVTKGASQ